MSDYLGGCYNTITALNYKDCSICSFESTNYETFVPLTKGYNLLKNTGITTTVTNDSLPDIVNDFYIGAIYNIESSLRSVEDLMSENIKDLQKYSWFSDWSQGKYNKEVLIFLYESEAYRKQLGRYRIYVRDNYIKNIQIYNNWATEILEKIDLELERK